MKIRPQISKVDAVVAQLEAAVFLTLKDFGPEPIHTLVWSSRSILHDLHKVEPNPILTKFRTSIDAIVKPEYLNEWRKYEVRAANFLKHADRDPEAVLEGVDLVGVNALELPICILAVAHHLEKLPNKLLIGFAYFGFLSSRWMDFEGICNDYNIPDYNYYETMTKNKRKQMMLEAFEQIHEH